MAGMLEISDEEFKSNYAFPGGSVVKNLLANAGDLGLIPGAGRSPGEENGKPKVITVSMGFSRQKYWSGSHSLL